MWARPGLSLRTRLIQVARKAFAGPRIRTKKLKNIYSPQISVQNTEFFGVKYQIWSL